MSLALTVSFNRSSKCVARRVSLSRDSCPAGLQSPSTSFKKSRHALRSTRKPQAASRGACYAFFSPIIPFRPPSPHNSTEFLMDLHANDVSSLAAAADDDFGIDVFGTNACNTGNLLPSLQLVC